MKNTVQSIPEINVSMIATRNEIRELSYSANGLVTVDYDDIVLRVRNDGRKFNFRTIFEGLEELANNIDSEDLIEPLKGDILKDGRVVLNDGERRYLAIGILRNPSKELKAKWSKVKFLVNDKDMTDVDRAYQQLNSNNGGEQFDQFDEANAYRELRDGILGTSQTITEIALRATKSAAYVESRLKLADATDEEKELIRSNKVSATAYVQLTRQEQDPQKRVRAVKEKNDTGKKLKVKDVKNKPIVEICIDVLNIFQKIDAKFNPTGEMGNLLLDARAKVNAIKKSIQ